MVDDPSTDSVVSWSESGKSFIVWNESKFLRDVLPSRLPFDYKDMTSLTTWLHAIGYSKVEESEHWEYTADYLVRGQPLPPKDTSPCTPGGLMITPEFARIIERLTIIEFREKQKRERREKEEKTRQAISRLVLEDQTELDLADIFWEASSVSGLEIHRRDLDFNGWIFCCLVFSEAGRHSSSAGQSWVFGKSDGEIFSA
uniref:HSF-type DNA-binding domain-containing protein n=1 Tax=Brassica oleracea var. oleracea TaxID=109376 RepID=A0A0D3D7V7_BRAOL